MTLKQMGGYTINMSLILGKGSFGTVYQGVKEDTKEPVAAKIIPRDIIDDNKYLLGSLENQLKILQSVKSQHIVGFYDFQESNRNYYIFQQLCDGDLSKIIKSAVKSGKQLTESYCINILTQICEGFLALVKEGIIHRDLKPANILCRGEMFKIADFGYSKQNTALKINKDSQQKTEDVMMKTQVGTPLYNSIEILKSIKYTSKCDIWAVGFIFYEILHGKTPWTAQGPFQLIRNIEQKGLIIQRKDLSPNTIDFLKKCLQIYEKDRISWNEVFIHPIFESKFLTYADENKEFENKMKSIMARLRIHFQLNKKVLDDYLSSQGFKNSNEELSFKNYFAFLKVVSPTITEEEAMYIFKKTDIDGNQTISLDQILEMLKVHGIAIDDPTLSKSRTQKAHLMERSRQAQAQKEKSQIRFQQCFKKLYKMIVKNKLKLHRVFKDFDKPKKGYLTLDEFRSMLQKLSKDITDQDAKLAFMMMDDDKSGSLQYVQMSRHFREINGIQQTEFQ